MLERLACRPGCRRLLNPVLSMVAAWALVAVVDARERREL